MRIRPIAPCPMLPKLKMSLKGPHFEALEGIQCKMTTVAYWTSVLVMFPAITEGLDDMHVITVLLHSLKVGDIVVFGVLYTVKENNTVCGNYVFAPILLDRFYSDSM
jgi:hypothetical protein